MSDLSKLLRKAADIYDSLPDGLPEVDIKVSEWAVDPIWITYTFNHDWPDGECTKRANAVFDEFGIDGWGVVAGDSLQKQLTADTQINLFRVGTEIDLISLLNSRKAEAQSEQLVNGSMNEPTKSKEENNHE